MNITHLVNPGEVLSIVADEFASGNLVRLSDAAGGEPLATTPIAASSSLLIGPFSRSRRWRTPLRIPRQIFRLVALARRQAGGTQPPTATSPSHASTRYARSCLICALS